MLSDDWSSPTSQKSREKSTTICDACKMLDSLNPQAMNIREPKAVKVATTATNKNVSNCQAFWKIPTRSWRSMNTCSFPTFRANQDLKPQFKQAKMEITPIKPYYFVGRTFPSYALMSQIWQVTGARLFFTEMGGCLENMAILDIDDVLTTMIP